MATLEKVHVSITSCLRFFTPSQSGHWQKMFMYTLDGLTDPGLLVQLYLVSLLLCM